MSAPTGRTKRIIGRTLRMPAGLDRRGMRWALQGLSPAPVMILVHRGRRSGKSYRTPVEALVGDPDEGDVVVSPMWGEKSDWYRNVLAGGLIEVRVKGQGHRMEWRALSEPERREAIATYRRSHPIYSRMILRGLVRLHRLEGDPVEAAIRTLPMLALTRSD